MSAVNIVSGVSGASQAPSVFKAGNERRKEEGQEVSIPARRSQLPNFSVELGFLAPTTITSHSSVDPNTHREGDYKSMGWIGRFYIHDVLGLGIKASQTDVIVADWDVNSRCGQGTTPCLAASGRSTLPFTLQASAVLRYPVFASADKESDLRAYPYIGVDANIKDNNTTTPFALVSASTIETVAKASLKTHPVGLAYSAGATFSLSGRLINGLNEHFGLYISVGYRYQDFLLPTTLGNGSIRLSPHGIDLSAGISIQVPKSER